MAVQIIALVVFAAVFVIAEVRRSHIGIVMFAAATGMGLLVAGLALDDIVSGFPIDILILLVGVTFFFGIAKSNGTIGRLVDRALRLVGGNTAALPLTFFVLTGVVSAMGSPLGGLVMAPIGMSVAHRRGIDPMLMALAIGTGLSAGGFAPTSLFGIVTWGTASSAGIALNPLTLFAIAIVANLILLAVSYLLFGARSRTRTTVPAGGAGGGTAGGPVPDDDGPVEREPFRGVQLITVIAMLGLVAAVIVLAVLGNEPDVGVLAFAFGAALTLIDPENGRGALKEIDWSTVLLVGGIITYVGVLQEVGAVDLLGDLAASLTVPVLAALVICAVCGLVSAFASTTGILAALVPLAIPLIAQGGLPGWALICALGVCSSVVDVSPFSTVGATLVATTVDPDERPRMTALLTRWGMSMVVIGPLALVGALVLPAMVIQ
ncbi:SLC13 family permease [Pseudonocardia parietis]|uniref:Di/tricarboxylate transporter n=1 Tax=Pseudonocardia parietis TaxID=570936 RepID=A0ABS4VXC3_9PSEU|nr:SLC13 family permease [Pseudonocardia parietis]MBP2368592.1 di/tricarboxylate transporter [Pseudonocardia parietis]